MRGVATLTVGGASGGGALWPHAASKAVAARPRTAIFPGMQAIFVRIVRIVARIRAGDTLCLQADSRGGQPRHRLAHRASPSGSHRRPLRVKLAHYENGGRTRRAEDQLSQGANAQ